jgi:Cu/Ag efflux protein CusF
MDRGSTSNMQMDHGTMPDMNHGSTSSTQMDQGTMPGMSHGSMSGMQMDHGSMSRMKHRSFSGMQMDHGAMPAMSHGAMSGLQMDHGSMPSMRHAPGRNKQMAHSGRTQAQSSGTVNSVDAAAHKVNVSHGPISAIGLPAMTMDFEVAPSVDLQTVKPDTRIKFTIEQGEDGMYVIQSIMPAGGGR